MFVIHRKWWLMSILLYIIKHGICSLNSVRYVQVTTRFLLFLSLLFATIVTNHHYFCNQSWEGSLRCMIMKLIYYINVSEKEQSNLGNITHLFTHILNVLYLSMWMKISEYNNNNNKNYKIICRCPSDVVEARRG